MKTPILDLNKYYEAIETIKDWHGTKMRAFTLCPYYVHPIRVATLVAKYKESHRIDELIIAALFHDIVEDTTHSLEEIDKMYGSTVAGLVEELTSNSDAMKIEGSKTQYLAKKMCEMSSWALVIKLCDRLDNVSDFMYANPAFIKRYSLETWCILEYILANRKDLSVTHHTIIQMIYKVLEMYNIDKE